MLLLRTGFCTSTGEEDEKSSSGSTSNSYNSPSPPAHTIIPATKHSPCTTFSFFTRGCALFHSSSCSSLSFYASTPSRTTTENSELVSTRCISSAENHWSIRNTVFVVVHSNSVLISYRKGIDEYTYRSVILDNHTMSE